MDKEFFCYKKLNLLDAQELSASSTRESVNGDFYTIKQSKNLLNIIAINRLVNNNNRDCYH